MTSALDGDVRFRSLYERHQDAVTRFFIRRLDRSDAGDATAEVFLVAWRRLGRVPEEPETLPWLYGVARNVLRNRRRAHRRGAQLSARLRHVEVARSAADPLVVTIEAEQLRQVRRALNSLRPTDREVIELRAFEGLNAAQIAIVVGCSHGAARKRLARALASLRRAFETQMLIPSPRATRKEEERERS